MDVVGDVVGGEVFEGGECGIHFVYFLPHGYMEMKKELKMIERNISNLTGHATPRYVAW